MVDAGNRTWHTAIARRDQYHSATHAEKYAKFVGCRDKTLAIIVLSVDPSLLYLLGNPEEPVAM